MSRVDKQPRRPSNKDATIDQLHPTSDMGSISKGGDHQAGGNKAAGIPKRMGGSDQTSVADNKAGEEREGAKGG